MNKESISNFIPYGASRAPHLLHLYSLNRVVLLEILYQTFSHQVTCTLKREKRSIWPKLPIRIGYYGVDGTKQAMKEANEIESYHFGEIRFRKHDPEDLVISHCVVVNQMWQIGRASCRERVSIPLKTKTSSHRRHWRLVFA